MAFDTSKLRSPAYFAENRVPAHSDHISYASRAEWAAGETSLRFSLSGLWKFHRALNFRQTIDGFESPDYDCRCWAGSFHRKRFCSRNMTAEATK